MLTPDLRAEWSSDAWRQLVTAWLDEQLAAAGTSRTGEVTQPHLRPWGTVLTAPTARGPVWLKAPGPDTAFEVRLYELLLRTGARSVLSPIAVDVERGWVLLPDGGTTLGDQLDGLDLAGAMVAILPQYGQLQRDLAPNVDDLLASGITDMRAPVMLQRFDEAVAAVGSYLDAYGDPAGWETHQRVLAMRDTFGGWCERLASATVPASLDHNDLHPWNILPNGTARFYDWGDSVVAHPFSSMLLGLGFVHQQLGVNIGDPAVTRPRDAYLEVFSDLAPHAVLVEELELACRVGKVARALTWDRSLRAQGYDQAGEFATAPLSCLAALLTDTWIAAI